MLIFWGEYLCLSRPTFSHLTVAGGQQTRSGFTNRIINSDKSGQETEVAWSQQCVEKDPTASAQEKV